MARRKQEALRAPERSDPRWNGRPDGRVKRRSRCCRAAGAREQHVDKLAQRTAGVEGFS